MHHNTNSRTIIQITKKCTHTNTRLAVCVLTHTCGARTIDQILWAGRAEKGEGLPLMTKFQMGPIPRVCFTPIAISSHRGTIGRLGELLLMLDNLMKWNFNAMARSRVINGIVYRASPVIIKYKPLQSKAGHVHFASVYGSPCLIFPIMTGVLYIPYITPTPIAFLCNSSKSDTG